MDSFSLFNDLPKDIQLLILVKSGLLEQRPIDVLARIKAIYKDNPTPFQTDEEVIAFLKELKAQKVDLKAGCIISLNRGYTSHAARVALISPAHQGI